MKLQTFKFNFKFIRLPKPDVVCNKCSTKTHYPRPITQDPRPKTLDPTFYVGFFTSINLA